MSRYSPGAVNSAMGAWSLLFIACPLLGPYSSLLPTSTIFGRGWVMYNAPPVVNAAAKRRHMMIKGRRRRWEGMSFFLGEEGCSSPCCCFSMSLFVWSCSNEGEMCDSYRFFLNEGKGGVFMLISCSCWDLKDADRSMVCAFIGRTFT